MIVNENFDIVHVSPNAGRFLHITGELSPNLFKLIRADLRAAVSTAVYQAVQRQTNVEAGNVQLNAEGESLETIKISVRPVLRQTDEAMRGFILIIFEPTATAPAEAEAVFTSNEPVTRQLEEALMRSQSEFRYSIELSEVQAEELKASNEELQAINEELRSASEELETGKEELQSVNEELITVNQELKIKIEELSQSNNDFQNLINSTAIGTIFLDRDFRVKLFTPAASEIFNLIKADAGRLLSDITHKLEYQNLISDVEQVLSNLQPVEREVGTQNGNVYLMQITPYRTSEDRINGTVIAFVNITERKKFENDLRESREHLQRAMEAGQIFSWELDLETREFSFSGNIETELGFSPPAQIVQNPPASTMRPEDALMAVKKTLRAASRRASLMTIRCVSSIRRPAQSIWLHSQGGLATTADGRKVFAGVAQNITTRKQAEEALRESETRYRTLFDSIDEGFSVCDMLFDEAGKPSDYVFVEVNPAFEKITGLKQAAGKTIRELIPEIEDSWFEIYGKVLQTGETVRFENRAAGLDNWYDVFASRVGDADSRRFVVTFTDITTRKQAEEALRESEIRFRATFEQANVGIVQLGFDGSFLVVNPSFCKIVGYTEEECRRLKVSDITHPDDSKREDEENRRLLAGEIKGYTIDKRYLHQNGSTVWGTMTTTLVSKDSGEPFYTLAIIEDITERKAAEESLIQSEERSGLLIEGAMDFAIFRTSNDGAVASWNSGAEKVFGWTESEIVGQPGAVLFTPEDRENGVPQKEMQTALEKGRAADERFHIRKDGTRFYVSGVMTRLNEGVEGFVKIARDMTEKLAAEKAFRDKEMLQKLVSAQEDERKRIARDLHDELGQLLTALRLQLEAVRKLCDDKDICGKVDEAQLTAKHLDAGIDFLAWELRPAALDDFGLYAALTKYAREWSHYSGIAGELLSSRVKKARFAPEVETNLYRIAQEACNNVYKHAEARRVEIVFDKRGDSIVLIVEDDGIGFEPEDKMNKDKGIGLVGMKERAALIGGKLETESAPGKGTIVFVRVPASILEKESLSAE